jgi:group II intron reverse transcriptase/maturase
MFGWGRSKLYAQVSADAILMAAWRKVKAGTAVAGIDGLTVAHFETQLLANLKAVQAELHQRRYAPQPVKWLSLPKADGTRRPVGILTVRDRLVQRAVLEVIEPVFDRDFEECSHGFRKGRSVQTAVAHLARLVPQYRWLVDVDIASFFTQINTHRLFTFLKAKIPDRPLRQLLRAWLMGETSASKRAGVHGEGAACGILQGGVLSPLFGNVYLDRFDKLALKQALTLVRYGDDIVVCCRSREEATATLQHVETLLATLDLTVNPRKTAIIDADQGIHFLGERLARVREKHAQI